MFLLQNHLYKLHVNRRPESYLSLYGPLDCDSHAKISEHIGIRIRSCGLRNIEYSYSVKISISAELYLAAFVLE